MLNSEIALNSQNFPTNFARDYDAHVYFDGSQREAAQKLREKVILEFSHHPIFTGELIDRLVGPHPLPMFEFNFGRELFPEVLEWLGHNRGELTVLVHEVTGDDPRDHSIGATWLGSRLKLDESKLDPSPLSGASNL